MKPIIGIVGRPGKSNLESDIISSEEAYRNSILLSGGIPFTILPPQRVVYNSIESNKLSKMTDSEIKDLNTILNICILVAGTLLILLAIAIFIKIK